MKSLPCTFNNFLPSGLSKPHFSQTKSVLSFWLVLLQLEGMNSGRNQDGNDYDDFDDDFGDDDDDDDYDGHDDDDDDAEVNDDDEIVI